MNTRTYSWDVRSDVSVILIGIVYALFLGSILAGIFVNGEYAMLAALMINFFIPPMLLIANGVYASRSEARRHPWRAALFPLACSLVSIPLLTALIMPYRGTCSSGESCTAISGDWYISWTSLDQVGWFVMVFSIASFLGFGVVLAAGYIISYAQARLRTA
ncbi:hypothetical protein COO72_11160 [Bifidobacterium callitrichos]|nr:hypothetical protein COO72_11160 [Bifidobacterium callitrichos]